MHLLPNTLAPLANAAEPKEGARWAVTGVRLTLLADGGWRAVATDTKSLLQASGPAALPADDFPTWKALEDAPNTATEALVPASHWAATFAAARKLTGRRRFPAAPKAVAVKLAPNLATFGFTDRDASRTEDTRLVEGKFPPVEMIWPKGKPALTVALDPKRLAALLRTMSALLPDGEQRVEFDFRDGNKAVILRASIPEMELKGLVMPLGERDGDAPGQGEEADTENAEAVAAWAKVAENYRVELAAVTAERDALLRELAEVKRERDAAVRDARECAAERDAAREELARTPSRPTEVRRPDSAPPALAERKLTRRERLAPLA